MIPKNNRDIPLEEIDGEQEFRFEEENRNVDEIENQEDEEENKDQV